MIFDKLFSSIKNCCWYSVADKMSSSFCQPFFIKQWHIICLSARGAGALFHNFIINDFSVRHFFLKKKLKIQQCNLMAWTSATTNEKNKRIKKLKFKFCFKAKNCVFYFNSSLKEKGAAATAFELVISATVFSQILPRFLDIIFIN